MKPKATQVIDLMYNNDPFSKWMGMERIEESEGQCTLRMTVRSEMLNGFGIAHGAITYTLADSVLAFASNSHGRQAVSIETSISHTAKVVEGDTLTAMAAELNCTDKIAVYEVRITNQDDKVVALFKGTVYRTPKEWLVNE